MFTFTVKPDGAPEFEVEATSRDIVRWEAGGKTRSIGALTDNLRMSDLTDLAWYAADRQGLYAGDIKQFRDGVDIEFEQADTDGDEDVAGPTPAAR